MPARGRPKDSKTNKLWGNALRKAALEFANGAKGPKKLEVAAKKVLDKIMEGDMTVVREFGDRIDGKVPQILAGDKDQPLRVITRIERVIVRPQTPNR